MPANLTSKATPIKLLEKCEAFSWASLEQMIEIARHSSLITLQSRQLLFSEGDQGSSLFILSAGELEIFKYKSPKNLFSDADIEELILSYSTSAGDIIGEWALTRDRQLRSASVRSTRETQLLEIPYSIIEKVGGLSQLVKFSSSRGDRLKLRDKLTETSSLFRALTQQKSLRELPHERSYSKGEDIFHEGDESSCVFYILSGSVEIYRRTEKGEQAYSTLNQHQLFGELGVILNTTRSASARAFTDCKLMLLEKNDFLPIAEDDYNMSQYLSALRRIYRNRSGEMVLQFHETIDGNPLFISSMRIEGDRELISQIGISNTFLKIDIKPQCSNAIVFMYKDKGRAIERTIEMEDGHITGLEFHGPTEEAGLFVEAIRNKAQFTAEDIQQFQSTGVLFTDDSDPDILCHCMQITRSELETLKQKGCDSADRLIACTGAGTICGGCRSDINAIVEEDNTSEMYLSGLKEVATDIFRARFSPQNTEPLPQFKSGQHAIIECEIHGEKIRRSYTLSSSGSESRWREITFKKEPHGLFTRWITDSNNKNFTVKISPPQGDFTAELMASQPIVFLVAGIGVTPAISCARARVQLSYGCNIVIDHSTNQRHTRPYSDELEDLSNEYSCLEYIPRSTSSGQRITLKDLEKYHQRFPGALWMICGPESYENDMQSALRSLEIDSKFIKRERFLPRHSLKSSNLPVDHLSLIIGLITSISTALILTQRALPEALISWQQTSLGHWISGSCLLGFLGWQWILPWQRVWNRGSDPSTTLHLHRRIGAFSPLLLLLHGSSTGTGLLGLISLLFITHTLIGVADRSLINDGKTQQTYLRWWLFPHIGISILLSALAIYHVWLILGHGGP